MQSTNADSANMPGRGWTPEIVRENAARRLWFVERVGPAPAGLLRGYSSVGRAVALQAIGQGFESPYLQSFFLPGWDRAKKDPFAWPSIGKGEVSPTKGPRFPNLGKVSEAFQPDLGPVAQLVRACA
jgi:hypothetical protein